MQNIEKIGTKVRTFTASICLCITVICVGANFRFLFFNCFKRQLQIFLSLVFFFLIIFQFQFFPWQFAMEIFSLQIRLKKIPLLIFAMKNLLQMPSNIFHPEPCHKKFATSDFAMEILSHKLSQSPFATNFLERRVTNSISSLPWFLVMTSHKTQGSIHQWLQQLCHNLCSQLSILTLPSPISHNAIENASCGTPARTFPLEKSISFNTFQLQTIYWFFQIPTLIQEVPQTFHQ